MEIDQEEVQFKDACRRAVYKSIKSRLRNVCSDVGYCALCFDNADEMHNINEEFVLSDWECDTVLTLKVILYTVLRKAEATLASNKICDKCRNEATRAYLFVQNSKRYSTIMQTYLNQLDSRLDEVKRMIDQSADNDFANTVLVIDDPLSAGQSSSKPSRTPNKNNAAGPSRVNIGLPPRLTKRTAVCNSRPSRPIEVIIPSEVVSPSEEVIVPYSEVAISSNAANHATRVEGYQEGSEWWLCDRHYYVCARRRKPTSEIVLRCADTGCKVTISIHERGKVVKEAKVQHNHEPLTWIGDRNRMFRELRQSVMESGDIKQPHQIYKEVAARHPVGQAHLPYEKVISSMRRWRRALDSAVPRSLNEFYNAIRAQTSLNNYVLGKVTSKGAHAIIFKMNNFDVCLRESTVIIIDPTYIATPDGMGVSQLLAIHGVYRDHYYHPIVVLMEKCSLQLYVAVLKYVWEACGDLKPAVLITDHDPVVREAVREVARMEVVGSHFHYGQALLRRALQLGLFEVKTNGSPEWQLIKLYGALAYLPPGKIAPALAELREICALRNLPFSQDFHDYYRCHWLGQEGAEYISVMNCLQRTMNVCANFRLILRHALGSQPNVWIFTARLCSELARAQNRFQRHIQGLNCRRIKVRPVMSSRSYTKQLKALNRGTSVREVLLSMADNTDFPNLLDERDPDGDKPYLCQERSQVEDRRRGSLEDADSNIVWRASQPRVAVYSAVETQPVAPAPRENDPLDMQVLIHLPS